ncbi:MAG: hypothetical protein Q7R88_01100 [bacterium]|nr:hypothetical protein [bacterium]
MNVKNPSSKPLPYKKRGTKNNRYLRAIDRGCSSKGWSATQSVQQMLANSRTNGVML